MKGFGYNILRDKTLRPNAKRDLAYTRYLSMPRWPYASVRQIERQQRQMADRLALPFAMERVVAVMRKQLSPQGFIKYATTREVRKVAKRSEERRVGKEW